MLDSKLDLLIRNSTVLENAKSSFGMGTFKRCNALNLTLRNIEADIDKINECISIIKGNSSIFSNFISCKYFLLTVFLHCFGLPVYTIERISSSFSLMYRFLHCLCQHR